MIEADDAAAISSIRTEESMNVRCEEVITTLSLREVDGRIRRIRIGRCRLRYAFRERDLSDSFSNHSMVMNQGM